VPDPIATSNWQSFQECWDATEQDKYIELADRCDKYYTTEQWEEAEINELGDKPALTINLASKTINAILGHYAATRADIILKPRRDATEAQAQAFSRLIDHILDSTGYSTQHEKQMVEDGFITDRGFLDIRLGFDDNILGEVTIKSRDPRTVVLDPNATDYDPATWTQVFTHDWVSIDDIELIYGKDKADTIQARVYEGETWGSKSIRFGGGEREEVGNTEEDRKRIRSVRVVERQYRRLGKVREFVSLLTGDTRVVPAHWEEERVQAVAQQYALALRNVMRSRVRWTVTADTTVLFDDWSPYDDFTLVPYFPYFRRGRPKGIMRDLLSPQDQLNKSESQELHIINTTANSGWMLEEGSLANMDQHDLEKAGSQTGLVLVYKKNRPQPQKIEPNRVPTGIERVSQKAASYIADIPGAGPLIGAMPKSDVSGVTLENSRDIALAGLGPAFANLALTRSFVARKIINLVQRFYTEPRLMRVTNWSGDEPTAEDLMINTDMLNNLTAGEYDYVVATAPARDTFADVQFAQAIEMRNAGIMIPDHYVIKYSQLADKKEIMETVKGLQGLGEPSPEQQQLEALQQRIAVEVALAELEKLQAEVQKTIAEAGLAQARSQGEMVDAQVAAQAPYLEMQSGRQRLIAELTKQANDLQNKLQLANMHIQAKNQQSIYDRTSKFAESVMKYNR
jgi:hypothetical protein